MIWERVTFTRPRPPTDYSVDVKARWDALRAAYVAMRNRERQQ